MGANKKPQEKPQPQKGGGEGSKGGKTGKKDHPPVVTGQPAKLKGAQKIIVHHILCSKESKIKEAEAKIAELRDAPGGRQRNQLEIFSAVAREYDEDKPRNAGYLGEMTKDKLDADFAKAAFELRESTAEGLNIGHVRTRFGYHLIIVTKRI